MYAGFILGVRMFLSIMKKWMWIGIISLAIVNGVLAKPISHLMTVRTNLDKNQFFDGQISISFKDKILNTEVSKDNKIHPVKTKVYVYSQLSTPASQNYSIFLNENKTTCIDQNEESISDDFFNDSEKIAKVFLNSELLMINQAMKFDVERVDGVSNYIDEYDFRLEFSGNPDNTVKCEGLIELMVGFEL